VLIDVNARFSSSLAPALASGVNRPAAWHAVVVDERCRRPKRYPVGASASAD
jgi:hypothetical protein